MSCDSGSHSTDAIYPARLGRHAFPELPPRTLYDLAPNGACLCPARCRCRRWSLTPPFHPYRSPGGNFLWRYPSACGVPRFPAAFRMLESGLSSPRKKGDCRTNLQKSKVKKTASAAFFILLCQPDKGSGRSFRSRPADPLSLCRLSLEAAIRCCSRNRCGRRRWSSELPRPCTGPWS